MTITAKQLEIAARKLCVIRSLDPDALIPMRVVPSALGVLDPQGGAYYYTEQWKTVATEVRQFAELLSAVSGLVP